MSSTTPNDEEEFEHAGLECKVLRVALGHYCGYVRRQDNLAPVRWRSDYDSKHDEIIDAEVEVWGGITYGPDEDGWVGFDDAHARSLVDHRDQETDFEAVREETKQLAEQIADLPTEDTESDHK